MNVLNFTIYSKDKFKILYVELPHTKSQNIKDAMNYGTNIKRINLNKSCIRNG